jgi:replication factor C small subunit
MNEFLFVEKYRPHKVADCILPDRLKKVFLDFVEKKEIPNLLLTGGAGVGKTTVALALCEEIGLDHIFINSSDERGIDTLRTKVKSYASNNILGWYS